MTAPRVDRRLAAILAADVVGYSRLIQRDEVGTLARLAAYRKALIEPLVAAHKGRIVKLMGDGMLCEFPSAVEAVVCAAEVQRGISDREREMPQEEQLRLRIGIDLGDVVVDGDDIHGEGVNIAARLEGLAEPGGICITRSVREQTRNRLDLAMAFTGRHKVKNISEPLEVWRVILDERTALARRATWLPRRARPFVAAAFALALLAALGGGYWWHLIDAPAAGLPLPDRPSIAVLPFDNLSGDPTQNYFVDGLTDGVITGLARFGGLFVIARNSSFAYRDKHADARQVGRELGVRYVLEGRVQKSPDRLRVTAQLVDAATGAHIWAERYDRPLLDLLAVQDDIAHRIASALGTASGGAVQRAELARATRSPAEQLAAYDLLLRALHHLQRLTEADNALARQHLHKAIALDPHLARAHAGIAISYWLDYGMGVAEGPEVFPQISRHARAAVEADPGEPWAYWALAYAHLVVEGQHDLALAAFEKALALNPNDADMLSEYGWALAWAGRAEDGIAHMREAMRLNPLHPQWYLDNLALGYLVLRDHAQVVATLLQMRSLGRSQRLYLAASYARLGRLGEAREQVADVLARDPGLTVEEFAATRRFKRPEDSAYLVESLKLAGLPEASPDRPRQQGTN